MEIKVDKQVPQDIKFMQLVASILASVDDDTELHAKITKEALTILDEEEKAKAEKKLRKY